VSYQLTVATADGWFAADRQPCCLFNKRRRSTANKCSVTLTADERRLNTFNTASSALYLSHSKVHSIKLESQINKKEIIQQQNQLGYWIYVTYPALTATKTLTKMSNAIFFISFRYFLFKV